MSQRTDIMGAIEYTRLVTKSMNRVLKHLRLYNLGGEQTTVMTDENWQEILNTFSSLNTILESDIPLISVEFLKYLVSSDDLGTFTDKFMDTRVERDRLPKPDYVDIPSSWSLK